MVIPPRVWGCYARRTWMVAQRNGHQVYDQRAFEDACALDAIRRLADQAAMWWAMFEGLTPERLAECLVDGSPPRHERLRYRARLAEALVDGSVSRYVERRGD